MYKTNQERTQEYLKRFDRYKVLKSLVPHIDPVVFDIGANIGQTTKEILNTWPEATVHCFEPLPEFYNKLVENTQDNKNVICNNIALSNKKNNKLKFYYHDIQPMLSGINRLNINSKDSIGINEPELAGLQKGEFLQNANQEITVNADTLSNYITENNVDSIDILKMDVQGAEPSILCGAGKLLKRVDVVITELNFYDLYEASQSFYEIEKYLIPAGFRLWDIAHISKNPMNGRTDWVDVIYKKI